MTRIDVGPNHYVLLCARRYAETLQKYGLNQASVAAFDIPNCSTT
jgi:hypothetical protein